MATRQLKPVDSAEESDEFAHSEVTLHGVTYQLRELDSKVYDECCELATKENGDIDTVLLLKIMLPKVCVSPKLTADKVGAMPMSLRRSLLEEVDRLHFPPVVLPKASSEAANSA